MSYCRSRGWEFNPQPGHIALVAYNNEIFFYGHSPPSADQERLLSVTEESIYTSTG